MKPSHAVSPTNYGWIRVAGLCLVLISSGAVAQPVNAPEMGASQAAYSGSGGWGVRAGYNSDYQKYSLVYQTPVWWASDTDRAGRFELIGELVASYWDGDEAPSSMWSVGAIPIVRWWPGEHFFAEIGTGPTLLSRTRFAGRTVSTAFQFSSHIGVGTVFGKSHLVSVRWTHVSNAGIKKPNPGLDLLQVSYTYRF